MSELLDVLARPRLARFLDPELRDELLGQLDALTIFFSPIEVVTECRDAKDNKYLELALAAGAASSSAATTTCCRSTHGVACESCGHWTT